MTEAERERLVMLMEECGEIIQACAKILRYGRDSVDPLTGVVNGDNLRDELDDLDGIYWAMRLAGDIPLANTEPRSVWERKQRWTKHQ